MSIRIQRLAGVAAAVALLLSGQLLAAQSTCCMAPTGPCFDSCSSICGGWEIGAHALYQTPTNCRFTYAVSNAITGEGINSRNGVAHDLTYSADWGYRIFGRYLKDCSFLGLSYQWIDSSSTDSVVGTNVYVWGLGRNQDMLSKASSHSKFKYQNVDVRWGHYLHRSCAGSFYYFGNVRWIDYSLSRELNLVNFVTGQTGLSRENGKLQGAAIGAGVGAERDLWCNIGIFGEGNVLGVIADQSLNVVAKDNNSDLTSFLSYPSNLYISPEAVLRIGLNYEWACDCLRVVFETGYEIDYLWNALASPELLNTGMVGFDPTFGTHCISVGFSGLFFGGKLLF